MVLGTPFTISDTSLGGGPNQRRLQRNGGRPEQFDFIIPNAFAYRSVDVRLEKGFRFAGAHRVSVAIEGINIFSFDNFADIDGEIPTLPSVNRASASAAA